MHWITKLHCLASSGERQRESGRRREGRERRGERGRGQLEGRREGREERKGRFKMAERSGNSKNVLSSTLTVFVCDGGAATFS